MILVDTPNSQITTKKGVQCKVGEADSLSMSSFVFSTTFFLVLRVVVNTEEPNSILGWMVDLIWGGGGGGVGY